MPSTLTNKWTGSEVCFDRPILLTSYVSLVFLSPLLSTYTNFGWDRSLEEPRIMPHCVQFTSSIEGLGISCGMKILIGPHDYPATPHMTTFCNVKSRGYSNFGWFLFSCPDQLIVLVLVVGDFYGRNRHTRKSKYPYLFLFTNWEGIRECSIWSRLIWSKPSRGGMIWRLDEARTFGMYICALLRRGAKY